MWLTCDPLSVVSVAYMGMHGSNVACIQWMRGYLLEHVQLLSSYITEENAVVSSEAISGWYSPVQGWNLMSLSRTHDGCFRMYGSSAGSFTDALVSCVPWPLTCFWFRLAFVLFSQNNHLSLWFLQSLHALLLFHSAPQAFCVSAIQRYRFPAQGWTHLGQ